MNLSLSSWVLFCILLGVVHQHPCNMTKVKSIDTEIASFCLIAQNPKNYKGKMVQTTAIYQTSLMGQTLLLDSSCEEISMLFAIDCDKKEVCDEIKSKIEEALKSNQDSITQKVEITFIGVLKKNKHKGVVPIKGVLQNYTMHIKQLINLGSS